MEVELLPISMVIISGGDLAPMLNVHCHGLTVKVFEILGKGEQFELGHTPDITLTLTLIFIFKGDLSPLIPGLL